MLQDAGTGRHHTQDTRRRHRCGLRPARRPGAGQDQAPRSTAFNPLPDLSHGHQQSQFSRIDDDAGAVIARRLQQLDRRLRRRRRRSPRRLHRRCSEPGGSRAACTPSSRAATTSAGKWTIAIEELNIAVGARRQLRARVQHLRTGLCGARRRPEGRAELRSARSQLAPGDSDIHHNWGWYLCQHKREREALAQFEIAVRNTLYRTPEIALVNAGRCAQTHRRHPRRRSVFPARPGRATGQCARELRSRADRVQGSVATTKRAAG